MKKLFFSLIATVLLSSVSFAQVSKEEVRLNLAKSMTELVNICKPTYKKGASYETFKNDLIGNSTVPTEGENLLKKAYSFLNAGTSSDDILKSYNGKEMASAIKLAEDAPTAAAATTIIFGSDVVDHTPFGQNLMRGCWICGVWDWIWGHRKEIMEVIGWIIITFP